MPQLHLPVGQLKLITLNLAIRIQNTYNLFHNEINNQILLCAFLLNYLAFNFFHIKII